MVETPNQNKGPSGSPSGKKDGPSATNEEVRKGSLLLGAHEVLERPPVLGAVHVVVDVERLPHLGKGRQLHLDLEEARKRGVQQSMSVGQFDFVCSSARTYAPRGHGGVRPCR